MRYLVDERERQSFIQGYHSRRALLRGCSDGPDMSGSTSSVAGTGPLLLCYKHTIGGRLMEEGQSSFSLGKGYQGQACIVMTYRVTIEVVVNPLNT